MTDRKQSLIALRDKAKAGEFFTGPSSLAQEVLGIDNTRLAHSAFHGSLDAAKALHEAVGLPVPEKMHSDARIELLEILEALIAQDPGQ